MACITCWGAHVSGMGQCTPPLAGYNNPDYINKTIDWKQIAENNCTSELPIFTRGCHYYKKNRGFFDGLYNYGAKVDSLDAILRQKKLPQTFSVTPNKNGVTWIENDILHPYTFVVAPWVTADVMIPVENAWSFVPGQKATIVCDPADCAACSLFTDQEFIVVSVNRTTQTIEADRNVTAAAKCRVEPLFQLTEKCGTVTEFNSEMTKGKEYISYRQYIAGKLCFENDEANQCISDCYLNGTSVQDALKDKIKNKMEQFYQAKNMENINIRWKAKNVKPVAGVTPWETMWYIGAVFTAFTDYSRPNIIDLSTASNAQAKYMLMRNGLEESQKCLLLDPTISDEIIVLTTATFYTRLGFLSAELDKLMCGMKICNAANDKFQDLTIKRFDDEGLKASFYREEYLEARKTNANFAMFLPKALISQAFPRYTHVDIDGMRVMNKVPWFTKQSLDILDMDKIDCDKCYLYWTKFANLFAGFTKGRYGMLINL